MPGDNQAPRAKPAPNAAITAPMAGRPQPAPLIASGKATPRAPMAACRNRVATITMATLR